MTGLARVYRALDNIESNAKLGNGGKIDKAVQNLIDMGVEQAQGEYSGSGVEDAANVRVSGSLTAQEGKVTATGAKILFVEFGTGVNLNSGSEKGIELGYTPASWSTSEQGKGFLTGKKLEAFHGWWPIGGTSEGAGGTTLWTQGHAPVNAMLHAAERMKQFCGKLLEVAFK